MKQKRYTGGLVMWRERAGAVEILLVHPGGPYYQSKDAGVWSIPKGLADNGEEGTALLEVAKREFQEETSFIPTGEFAYVGSVERKDGKVVEAWAFQGDCDPEKISSNTCLIEWPPRSGAQVEIPEVDRAAFFTIPEARLKLSLYLVPLLDQFELLMKH